MNLYTHQIMAANYQSFVDAGIKEWYAGFSHQLKYAQAWADTKMFTPQEAKEWAAITCGNPDVAVDFKSNGFTPETAKPWLTKTTYGGAFCAELAKRGRRPGVITQPRPQRTR